MNIQKRIVRGLAVSLTAAAAILQSASAQQAQMRYLAANHDTVGSADDRAHADLTSVTFAAAHTAKQQCINACRARYHDCRHLNQLPPFECRSIYQDCTRYSCTGLGPG
jgi:hypothetical protein